MNLDEITARLHAIRDHNDWRQFHSPKNLAMAASVEMAELVEIFQWLSEDESRQLPADSPGLRPTRFCHVGSRANALVTLTTRSRLRASAAP